MGTAKFDIEKFTGNNDFGLWRLKMRALLVQQGLELVLEGDKKLPTTMDELEKKRVLDKAHSTLILCLGARVLREVSKEKSAASIWQKLENLYMTKSLANRLYLKQNLYTLKMLRGRSLEDHLDDLNKIILDLENIDIKACKDIGIGSIKLKLEDGTERVLHDVSHVPDLKRNLISLGMLDSSGFSCKVEGGVLKVMRGSLVVMKDGLENGLYLLQGRTTIVNASVVADTGRSKAHIWHMRLGEVCNGPLL